MKTKSGRPGRATGARKSKPRIKPLPPTAAEARDEGPRLIPLGPLREPTGLEHYLALADVALGVKKK